MRDSQPVVQPAKEKEIEGQKMRSKRKLAQTRNIAQYNATHIKHKSQGKIPMITKIDGSLFLD